MAQAKYLTDKDGNKFYPYAHAGATYMADGTTVQEYITENTYDKPDAGIPKTDLASDVQASLGKADTALQSFTETDPTVPSHVKSITTANIASWNAKSNFSGNYNDLTNKPTIPDVSTFARIDNSNDNVIVNEVTEIVNGLNSYATDKPLSANQGRILNEDLNQTNATLKAMSTMTSSDDLDYSIEGNIESARFEGYARKSKNLFNPTLQSGSKNGLTYTRNEDGTYLVSGTTTAQTSITFGSYPFESGTQYRLVGFNGNGIRDNYTLYVNGIGYPNDLGKGVTFTASSTAKVGIILLVPSGTTVNMLLKPMITTDTSATYNDYEPYGIIKPSGVVESRNKSNTESSTINLPYTPLGVNEIKDELIVYADGTGKFIKRVEQVDLGTLNWSNSANYWSCTDYGARAKTVDASATPNLICETLEAYRSSTIASIGKGTNYMAVYHTNGNLIATPNESPKGLMIYELATPQEIALTSAEVAQILALKTFAEVTYIDADGLAYDIGYLFNSAKAIKDLKDVIKALTSTQTLDVADNANASMSIKSVKKIDLEETPIEEITEAQTEEPTE